MDEICLYLVGPTDWFENLKIKCEKYGQTYAQYNIELKRGIKNEIQYMIRKNKFIKGYGHVSMRDHKGKAKVEYQLIIESFDSSRERKPPPNKDLTPSFEWYDKEMGKCKDESDFKYETWFKVTGVKKISPIGWMNFIRHIPGEKTGKELTVNDRRLLQYGMFLVYPPKVEINEEEPAHDKFTREYEDYKHY